jgi:hypothetical protein
VMSHMQSDLDVVGVSVSVHPRFSSARPHDSISVWLIYWSILLMLASLLCSPAAVECVPLVARTT